MSSTEPCLRETEYSSNKRIEFGRRKAHNRKNETIPRSVGGIIRLTHPPPNTASWRSCTHETSRITNSTCLISSLLFAILKISETLIALIIANLAHWNLHALNIAIGLYCCDTDSNTMAALESSFAGVNSAMVPDWQSSEHSTGTSIMAVEFDGGVVLGADSRTTTGAYIANRVTDKLTPITERIFCCRSGSAADTQAVADIVKYNLDVYRMQMGEEPTVFTAANMFREMCYNYREQLTAGIIVAGWDKKKGGQVYTVPLGGMLVRQPISIGGSGSTYVYGHVDATFKEGMTKEQGLQFCAGTLALAMARDGSSGGVIRLAAITEAGVERHVIPGNQLPKFWEG